MTSLLSEPICVLLRRACNCVDYLGFEPKRPKAERVYKSAAPNRMLLSSILAAGGGVETPLAFGAPVLNLGYDIPSRRCVIFWWAPRESNSHPDGLVPKTKRGRPVSARGPTI